jgi:DNA-binding transcriptional MerR regulator
MLSAVSERPLQVVGSEGSPEEAEYPFTIEELAAETGFTVRNIRSHRARGLLQPPAVRDRIGYYGQDHIARLKLVRQLQDEGFNLAAIKRVVERAPASSDQILGAIEMIQQPFEVEDSQVFTREELRERFGVEDNEGLLRKAADVGVLIPLGEDRFEAPAPSLLDVAEELDALGVPLSHALAVVGKVRDSSRTIARAFVRLFVDDVVKPFEAEGMPPERWPEIAQAIERLRPMSAQVVLSVYRMTMSDEVDREAPKVFERLTKGRSR